MHKPPKSNTAGEGTRIEFIPYTGSEKRLSARKPTQDLSNLKLGVHGQSVTCMVHNISETGALLETSIRDLPDRFILENPNENLRKLCRIVWSCGELTGVEFVNSSSATAEIR